MAARAAGTPPDSRRRATSRPTSPASRGAAASMLNTSGHNGCTPPPYGFRPAPARVRTDGRHGTVAAPDDRALHRPRMLGHERHQLVVGEVAAGDVLLL